MGKYYLFLLFILLSWEVRAQGQVEYIAELDTNYIMIGDQVGLQMKVIADPGIQVVFPHLQDTVAKGVEIISGPVRDSIREKDGRMLFRERYLITAFDSGVYVLPAMPIRIERAEYNNIVRTDPLMLVVNTYTVDPEKNFDIVMPVGAPWTLAEILPYLVWYFPVMLLVAIAMLILIWVKSRKRKQGSDGKPVIPPYVLAMQALNTIKEEKLWQQGRVKDYYTQLTDAIRSYMEGELSIAAMEQTTSEIMEELEDHPDVDPQERRNVVELLQSADLVKFAKMLPLADESARDLNTAFDFVNHTHDIVQKKKAEEAARKEKEEEEARIRAEAEAAATASQAVQNGGMPEKRETNE